MPKIKLEGMEKFQVKLKKNVQMSDVKRVVKANGAALQEAAQRNAARRQPVIRFLMCIMLLFLRLIVVVMEYCRIFLSAGTQSPFRYGNIFQSCGPALFVPGQDRHIAQVENQ